jgi:hypothetical protein
MGLYRTVDDRRLARRGAAGAEQAEREGQQD